MHGEAQPTVGSSMIPFAASARSKQQISRGPVVPSGLDFSNTMILLDEYDPVGFASRPVLEILQRTSNEVCADDCCRPVVQRARLRCLRLRVGHPPPPLKICAPGWYQPTLSSIIAAILESLSWQYLRRFRLPADARVRPPAEATPQGEASTQLPATRLANSGYAST